MNVQPRSHIRYHHGLQQGDHFSPYFFILVVSVFAKKFQEQLIEILSRDAVPQAQYADVSVLALQT